MSILTDVHTHTSFSCDGRSDVYAMLDAAKQNGIKYWGVSDHFDYDYLVNGITYEGNPIEYIDAEKYFTTLRKLQKENNDINILVGGEFGFTYNKKAIDLYSEIIEKYNPDFVVNSVHTNAISDWCELRAYDCKTKKQAYNEYLSLVYDSLQVDYHYDIVSHLGYPSRFAPYENREMFYEDFADKIDDILKTIISYKKILEVNTSVKGLDLTFLPSETIVKRYFELGGREISFASDAHFSSRLLDKRQQTVDILKKIGFEYITVPFRKQKIKAEI